MLNGKSAKLGESLAASLKRNRSTNYLIRCSHLFSIGIALLLSIPLAAGAQVANSPLWLQTEFNDLVSQRDRTAESYIPFIWHRGLHAVGVGAGYQPFGGDDAEGWFYAGIPIQENSVMSYHALSDFSSGDKYMKEVQYQHYQRLDKTGPATFACSYSELTAVPNIAAHTPINDCADVMDYSPQIVEADPRRTIDHIWYAHHDVNIDREKNVNRLLSDVTAAEYNAMPTIWRSSVGSDNTLYPCPYPLGCDPATMDEVFDQISGPGNTQILALHMHGQQDLIDMATYMFRWEQINGKSLFDHTFFLEPIGSLGDQKASITQVQALWTTINLQIRQGFEQINAITRGVRAFPKVYVVVNLYDQAQDLDSGGRAATLQQIIDHYSYQSGNVTPDTTVMFMGFGTTSHTKATASNANLQEIGLWAKKNGWHSVKAVTHPDTARTTDNQFCYRDTHGFANDESKDLCPALDPTRLITFIMGKDMVATEGSALATPVAKTYEVDAFNGNGQEGATIVTSDRPLLDANYWDLGTTNDVRQSSLSH